LRLCFGGGRWDPDAERGAQRTERFKRVADGGAEYQTDHCACCGGAAVGPPSPTGWGGEELSHGVSVPAGSTSARVSLWVTCSMTLRSAGISMGVLR
jgi:hypothetical protein